MLEFYVYLKNCRCNLDDPNDYECWHTVTDEDWGAFDNCMQNAASSFFETCWTGPEAEAIEACWDENYGDEDGEGEDGEPGDEDFEDFEDPCEELWPC